MTEDIKGIYDKIYRCCFFRIRNRAVAEDITQETFLRYFERNKRLRHGEDMAYLYTIARNLCIDHFRKRQAGELPEDFPAEDFSDVSDTKEAVRRALEKLDERQKEIILLRYIGGLSVNETAKSTEISRFAVHRLEQAALVQMKKYLKGAL